MKWKKVTAIVRTECLECVERKLQEIGVKGITVTHVKGFGEYANFSRRDWMVRHVRLETFVHEERVQPIVDAILETAHSGLAGDGIIAIQPVAELLHIRRKGPVEKCDV